MATNDVMRKSNFWLLKATAQEICTMVATTYGTGKRF
jgi:hypothetical protein